MIKQNKLKLVLRRSELLVLCWYQTISKRVYPNCDCTRPARAALFPKFPVTRHTIQYCRMNNTLIVWWNYIKTVENHCLAKNYFLGRIEKLTKFNTFKNKINEHFKDIQTKHLREVLCTYFHRGLTHKLCNTIVLLEITASILWYQYHELSLSK